MSEFPFDDFKETDFNEFERFFKTNTVNPIYDHRANFQTNSPSFYEYLAKHNHLIKILAKRIWEYQELIKKQFNEWDIEIKKRFLQWDKNLEEFDEEVLKLLKEWLLNGTLDHIINDTIFSWKADKIYVDEVNKQTFYNSFARRKNKPVMVIVDDDARKEFLTTYKPLIEELKFPVVSAVITSRIDNDPYHLTSDDMSILNKLGVEFVSHTHNHINLQQTDPEQIHEDLKQSRNWLLEKGYNSDALIYPYGIADFRAREIVAQYFRYGLLSDRGNGEINTPPLLSYGLQRAYIDYGVLYIKSRLDDIKTNGGALIMGTHCHYEDFNIEDVREIVNYARILDIDIVNMRDFHNYYGNILEFGDASSPQNAGGVIDSEGNVHGELIGRVISRTILNDDLLKPMSEFPYNAILRGHVTSANSTGFPENKAGILEVHRFKSPTFDYQEYEILGTGDKYRRKWVSGSWTNWEKVYTTTIKHPTVPWSKKETIQHAQLSAGQALNYQINSSLFVEGRVFVAQPTHPLENRSITWSIQYEETGKGRLVVTNPTNTVIPAQTIEWKVIGIDTD